MKWIIIALVAATTLRGGERVVNQITLDVENDTVDLLKHGVIALPKTVSKKQEENIIAKLSVETAKLADNVVNLKAQAKKEKTRIKEKMKMRSKMSEKDKKVWDHFSAWDERMNRKSLATARDVLSKLKNAVHFIKKGALRGDKDAHKNLESVVSEMGNYLR